MIQKISLFFLLLFGLSSKAAAESIFSTPFHDILTKLEETFCSKSAILFLSFALLIAYVRLFPPKEQKEDEDM